MFVKCDPNMPLQMIRAFLLIAIEGQGTMELAKQAAVANTVMSRHLADLGDLNRYHEEGHDLGYQKADVLDRRRKGVASL
jgi:hypothetical protein